ncbi:uncharacterized protein LOC133831781 [Humulus lupulus]|uniref:uncharacterized protein LOC133831781 n=1 Tax=Humulus lupulus TaxID=3486 RepID=UPI002B414C84|nr:uncharacterized protein LOC133831781 [Humulus lupulus]
MDRILVWNVRGINSQHKHKEIRQLIYSKKVGLVSLLETKVKNKSMGDMYMSLFPGWCFTNNNSWLDKGRIIVAWNPSIYSIDIRRCTSQMIHCIAQTSQNTEKFHIAFVYGFNEVGGREVLWQDLKDLKSNIDEPWMIVGDFNEILNYDERAGSKNHKKPSDSFKECVMYCQMEDLKFSGCFFTWNNKKKPEERIFSKIDRALVNLKWTDSFVNSDVVFLPEGEFDHCPILISFYQDVSMGKKPFRYFSTWKTTQNYKTEVRQSWQIPITVTPMYQLVGKMKRLKSVFRTINREGFNEIHKAVLQAKQVMLDTQAALHMDHRNTDLMEQEQSARDRYSYYQQAHNSFLAQKAKIDWI